MVPVAAMDPGPLPPRLEPEGRGRRGRLPDPLSQATDSVHNEAPPHRGASGRTGLAPLWRRLDQPELLWVNVVKRKPYSCRSRGSG